MKKIPFLFLLASCSKTEDNTCKTCYETVTYKADNGPTQTYIQSATKYCSGEDVALEGKTTTTSGSTSGHNWTKTVKTHCE